MYPRIESITLMRISPYCMVLHREVSYPGAAVEDSVPLSSPEENRLIFLLLLLFHFVRVLQEDTDMLDLLLFGSQQGGWGTLEF